MAEKYLGEQGLAKLIKLVKENSGGSPIYVKSRKAPSYRLPISLTQRGPQTFVITVTNPFDRYSILSTIYWTGSKSYTSPNQVFAFTQNGLWITEVYMGANESNIDICASLFYIGTDENAINSGNFGINSAKKIGDV